jgi:Arginase family
VVIDDVVTDIDAARCRMAGRDPAAGPVGETVKAAFSAVRGPVLFATLATLLATLPLLFLGTVVTAFSRPLVLTFALAVLSSMVVAALLGEGDPGYAGLAGPVPMLPPRRLAILGYDDGDIDPRERHLLGPPLSHADGRQVAADPAGAAATARAHVEASAGAIVVHFDVDAVDSADLPLANYPHHGKGLTFDAAMTVLRELCAGPAFTCLVLTEVNPTHDPGGDLLGRYVGGVTAALAGPARDW